MHTKTRFLIIPLKGDLIEDRDVLIEICNSGRTEEYSIEFAEKQYPYLISAGVVEIVIQGLELLGKGAIAGVGQAIGKALWESLQPRLKRINVILQWKADSGKCVSIPREERDKSAQLIADALTGIWEEMHNKDNRL